MGLVRVIAAVSLLATLASAARAEPAAPAPAADPARPAPASSDEPTSTAPPPPAATKRSLGHRFQVGLGLRAGTGYRVIMPYNEEPCGEADKSVCGDRQPVWLELSPSFGVSDSLELLADVRFYLEEDFTATRGLFVAPGVKYYTDPADLMKFFFTGQVVLEHQAQQEGVGPSSFDVGIRSALGIQFDVMRYLGLYAQGGIILGFKRWLTFTVDFAGGVQVRY